MSKQLLIEVNRSVVSDRDPILTGGHAVLITPPLNEDFWLARVPVSKTQAVVCFPKFGTIGIGFQHEEDWNTNLPYSCSSEEIYNHIKHNKACSASREKCIQAIQLIREWAIAKAEGR